MMSLTAATARLTPRPRRCVPPSRRSTASRAARCTGRGDSTADGATGEVDFCFDGWIAARVPDAAGAERGDGGAAHEAASLNEGETKASSVGAWSMNSARPARRTMSRLASVRYSTGDLPSTRASMRAGSSVGDAGLERGGRLPTSRPARSSSRRRRSTPEGHYGSREMHRLQDEVVEAEGDVERRIARGGAFGVEQDGALGAGR